MDVRNGKIAKVTSTLTPEERNCFFDMVSESAHIVSEKNQNDEDISIGEISENNDILIDNDENDINKVEDRSINFKENELEYEDIESKDKIIDVKEVNNNCNKVYEENEKETIENDAKKVSAQKLIKEFTNFLNSIS